MNNQDAGLPSEGARLRQIPPVSQTEMRRFDRLRCWAEFSYNAGVILAFVCTPFAFIAVSSPEIARYLPIIIAFPVVFLAYPMISGHKDRYGHATEAELLTFAHRIDGKLDMSDVKECVNDVYLKQGFIYWFQLEAALDEVDRRMVGSVTGAIK